MNKRLGIVITDGVGYRNFLLSTFLEKASKKFDSVVIYSGLPADCYDLDSMKNVEVHSLEQYRETKKVWFFRKLKEVSHMYLHRRHYGINDNLTRAYPKKLGPRQILLRFIYWIAAMFKSESFIQKVEKRQFKSFKKDDVYQDYVTILKETQPDVLFFSHQRPAYLSPMLAAAKHLKIKTTSFIFSWDNLASKGRMLGDFDGYFVWSNLMRDELKEFYPLVNEDSIFVVGTPQFEPYIMDKYLLSKEEFYAKFNLDPNKKVVCYSCADADIGRNDETHIRSVIKYCDANDVQLLVRTSPAEDGKRFKALQEEFPQVKWNYPKWYLTREHHAEAWSQRLPTVEDVIDLKSIVMYCDANVNMLSTMSMDFMLFDKPVVNVVFGNKSNGLYDDQRFLNYTHYKYVVDSKAVTIAMNDEELETFLDEAINKPKFREQYRKDLLDFEISVPLQKTNQELVNQLETF